MAIVMVVVSMIATTALCSRSTYKISWDSTPTGTSSATATVEVVTNPLLDSESGSHKEVADEIWKHLEDLNADLVRYLAWFPYPRYAVAKDTTGWRTDKVASMLGCFLDATEKKGHKTVLNFAAQPAHLFEPVTVANMSDDPSEPAWSYANGKLPKENKKLVVDYYKTLWRLIKYGWVLDNETGENVTLCNNDGDCVHSGLSHWEFFNDNEHYLTAEEYTELYNGIKDDIVSTLGAENAPKFIVGGGMSPSMATSVLDKINGDADYLSFNYRASPRERANPFTYEE